MKHVFVDSGGFFAHLVSEDPRPVPESCSRKPNERAGISSRMPSSTTHTPYLRTVPGRGERPDFAFWSMTRPTPKEEDVSGLERISGSLEQDDPIPAASGRSQQESQA